MKQTALECPLNCREDFPLIHQQDLAFLDSASTTQKPQSVIDRESEYYEHHNANIHRGIYRLSEQVTAWYESVRSQVAQWMNAQSHEVIFCRGTTEALNMVATCYLSHRCQRGGNIIVSAMEHHANLLPWQRIAQAFDCEIRVIKLNHDNQLDLEHYQSLLDNNTQMVTVTHVSNVLGTVNPIKTICEMAHQYDIPVCVDGAQAVAHIPMDVQDLGCDFYTFSGHKLYAPTGTGVLFAAEKWMKQMQPAQVGGGIITEVTYSDSQLVSAPHCFEAGTPNISGVIALGSAIAYIQKIPWSDIMEHERQLLDYLIGQFDSIDGLTIAGSLDNRVACLSFSLDAIHPHDIASILDRDGVLVRAGHLCAMPLVKSLGYPSLTRVSLGLYNNHEDIDRLIRSLKRVVEIFNG
ncbi:MAG: cysteine desulfurase CsdA [Legionellales bacterium]|nr:cysteine desulfurase CsdA [Legionellales bacterium]|tara:strand:+ start:297 stop:1517 length:1221 start_codon:yes stop_codon:yes gene_type:complete